MKSMSECRWQNVDVDGVDGVDDVECCVLCVVEMSS